MVVRTAAAWIQVISVWWLTQGIVAHASSSTAKSGCENFCGNVEIPYPFGMGTDCSMGEWFSVDCDNSTTPAKPFLSKIRSEVTDISLLGTISINFPISSTCNSTVQSVDLTGSPFVFSVYYNKFTGVGCNNLALMVSNSFNGSTASTIGGCLSLCNNKTLRDTYHTCNGINCCQTTIADDLKVFGVNLTKIQPKEGKGCKFGFLVNETWFNSRISRFSNLKNLEFVPAVLEWSIPEQMSSLVPGSSNSTDCLHTSREALYLGVPSSPRICCERGFEGNPYLPDGCQDIDECKDPAVINRLDSFNNHSSPGITYFCRNTVGDYVLYPLVDPPGSKKPIGIGVGIASGVLILLLGGWGLHQRVKRRKKAKQKEKFFKRNGGLLLKQQLAEGELNVEKTKVFDSKELEKATDRFNANRTLGQGGQGTVYKGMLVDGKIVAVKKSKKVDKSKIEEFINEVVILSQINHRNIVKLMGCCLETEVPLLVYEFIPNGSLFNYLHQQNQDDLPLTWDMRMRIATEIAGALFYLHSAASRPIYHRDIKSSNILLDEKYRSKIADFGTSRSVAIDQTHLTTQVQGTFGYLDPEFFQSSQFTEKSDVYSFGVVLVELLTGQAPISTKRSMEGQNLAFYFIDSINRNALFDILDDKVIEEGKREHIVLVANLAKRCLSLNGRARPTMKEVVLELGSVQITRGAPTVEDSRVVDEYVMTEETLGWEEDNSMSTRSDLNSDTFRLLEP